MHPHETEPAGSGEHVFRLLVDNLEEYAVCATDSGGRIVSWNAGAARTYGYGEAEVIGQPIATLFTEEDRKAGAPELELRHAAALGRAEDERWHVRKDGSRLWASGLVVPVRETDGRLIGFGKITRDRTDLKQLQDALRSHSTELELANEEKSVFLATLAHEIRNPLNVLMQVAELLKRQSPIDQLRLSQMIARQVQHTKRLVDDLMDIARFGHKKLELKCAPLDLRDAISGATEMVRPAAVSRAVPLHVSIPECAVSVAGDGTRLVQIFANLTTNAVKFSEPESPVTISLTCEGGEAVTRVIDRGAGIPPDQLSSIFNLFSQAHLHRPTSEAGLGIGLALTRDLVLLHGGTIEAHSQGIGTGSEFVVRLPLLPRGRDIGPNE